MQLALRSQVTPVCAYLLAEAIHEVPKTAQEACGRVDVFGSTDAAGSG